MFGYITINKDELKVKDYNRYRAFYCGVCHSLGEEYGVAGRMTLSYDMTFLSILLSALYEDATEPRLHRCVPHPMKRHQAIYNEFSEYAAAMNVMLTYYKLADDWDDERSIKSAGFKKLLTHAYRKASRRYVRQARAIEQYIIAQRELENAGETQIDVAANPTGEMLAEIFCYKQDVWERDLRTMGFFLGKFIYVMDAYEDIAKDIKKNNYNPLISQASDERLAQTIEQILTMFASEGARAFERLPILDNADIIRNIIYSGMWGKYRMITRKNDNMEGI